MSPKSIFEVKWRYLRHLGATFGCQRSLRGAFLWFLCGFGHPNIDHKINIFTSKAMERHQKSNKKSECFFFHLFLDFTCLPNALGSTPVEARASFSLFHRSVKKHALWSHLSQQNEKNVFFSPPSSERNFNAIRSAAGGAHIHVFPPFKFRSSKIQISAHNLIFNIYIYIYWGREGMYLS